jgi:hypothetical protein
MPVTTPVVTPIDALAQVIDQVPPDGEQLSVVVLPIHALETPVITPGSAFTDTVVEERHPVGSV